MNIQELLSGIRDAKLAEATAKAKRLALEDQVFALCAADAPVEGTLKGEGFSITYKLNRSVDTDRLFAAYETLSANAKKAFRFKAEVSLTQYRALEEMDSAGFSTVADFVTTKPAKPSIEIKE